MDRLWRSSSSINSRTGCPPDIVNEENHNVDDSEIPGFSKWTIPKVDTKNVYKISWAENTFHSAYKVACLLKRILVNFLLLKNSVICMSFCIYIYIYRGMSLSYT